MNILHVISDLSPSTGGPVTAVSGMSQSQRELGHEVSIASTFSNEEEVQRIEGVTVDLHPCEFQGWRWSRSLSNALPGLVEKADIVHIHTVWDYPTYAASAACRKLGKPYIIRPCGMLDAWSLSQRTWKKKLYYHLFGHSIISNSAAIHFTSQEESGNSMMCDSARGRFTLPLGLAPSSYENLPGRESFIKRFPGLNNKRLLLFLGRLHYKKQPDIAIKSFHALAAGDTSIHLVMAGSGDDNYVSELKGLVNRLGLSERVTFTGMLDREAVREAYMAAYLFLLPSVQENFGIATAEALAAGCPVVVSGRVNLSSDIKHVGAGLVCEPEVEATTRALQRVLKSDLLRTEMSENGRKLIEDNFTWGKLSKKLTAVYEDILTGQHINPAWEAA